MVKRTTMVEAKHNNWICKFPCKLRSRNETHHLAANVTTALPSQFVYRKQVSVEPLDEGAQSSDGGGDGVQGSTCGFGMTTNSWFCQVCQSRYYEGAVWIMG